MFNNRFSDQDALGYLHSLLGGLCPPVRLDDSTEGASVIDDISLTVHWASSTLTDRPLQALGLVVGSGGTLTDLEFRLYFTAAALVSQTCNQPHVPSL